MPNSVSETHLHRSGTKSFSLASQGAQAGLTPTLSRSTQPWAECSLHTHSFPTLLSFKPSLHFCPMSLPSPVSVSPRTHDCPLLPFACVVQQQYRVSYGPSPQQLFYFLLFLFCLFLFCFKTYLIIMPLPPVC